MNDNPSEKIKFFVEQDIQQDGEVLPSKIQDEEQINTHQNKKNILVQILLSTLYFIFVLIVDTFCYYSLIFCFSLVFDLNVLFSKFNLSSTQTLGIIFTFLFIIRFADFNPTQSINNYRQKK
jgi:energy-coupling factor transporter transmembrane protein EcfT